MGVLIGLKDKAVGLVKGVISHWRKPAKGNFVSYREVLNYSVGGMGQQFVLFLLNYMALSAGNTLLGSTIGIRPMHLQYMAIMQTVINIFMTILRGKLVDNTRTKYGRFRPYIAFAGFPLVIMAVAFVFLPFETMAYTSKLICVFLFAISITTMQPLFTDTYTELGSVITPNSQERANVLMVSTLIYSFAPTITGFAVPLILAATGLTYTDINTYRYIVAPVAILGVGLNFFTAIGCKERIITGKTYVQKVGVWESISAIYKNKYWWIRTISGLVGFSENAFAVIFGWMYIYGLQDMTAYSLLTTLYGTASTIAMLITPLLLKKIGNRSILLLHNAMNILLVGLMYFTFRIPAIYFIILYLNTIFNQLQLVYNPVLNAEVKDYQQYLTNRRVDFMLGAASQITVPVSLATGLVIPFVYEAFGLTSNYNVLYDPTIRNSLFEALCLLSVGGAVLNLAPLLFYKLSREKHKMVILVLRQRAVLADLASGAAEPELIKEVVEGIRVVDEIKATEMPDMKALKRKMIDAVLAKNEGIKTKLNSFKEAYKTYSEGKKVVADKEAVAEIYDAEQAKFDKPQERLKLNIALALCKNTPNDVLSLDVQALEYEIPECDVKLKNSLLKLNKKYTKQMIDMQSAARKAYPNGVQKDYLLAMHEALNIPYHNREEAKVRDKAVEAAEKELNKFNAAFKFYNTSKELVAEYENRQFHEKLEAMYEDAVRQVAEHEREAKEAEQSAKNKAKAGGSNE